MLEHLQQLEKLRGIADRDEARFARIRRVKQWQHLRLAQTYRDLADDARYAKATRFFLDELYGDNETAIRDRDLLRMYPTIKRLLPQFAFDTVSHALELDLLSEQFDQAIAAQINDEAITVERYCAAFRAAGCKNERLHQVALMRQVGEGLELVVKKPFIYSTLQLLRRPARMAGLAEMQRFLEAGVTAFRHMGAASYFLQTIAEREVQLIEAIFAGQIPNLRPDLRLPTAA
jgi:hypothetical protein